MRGLRMPLSLKILSGLALNLAFVGLVSYFFAARDQSGWNMLLTQSVRDRVSSIARSLAEDIYLAGNSPDTLVLQRYSDLYGVKFSATSLRGPPGLRDHPPEDRGPDTDTGPREPDQAPGPNTPDSNFAGGPGPPFDRDHGPPDLPGERPSQISLRRAADRPGYDVVEVIVLARKGGPPRGFRFTAHAPDLYTLLRFLGIWHALSFAVLVLVGSAMLWWPFVWNLTRTIGRLREATRQIAAGHFGTHLSDERHDELGDLARDINVMASQLHANLQGQRQFIADVAHEVISPVARMQIGIGILEAQADQRGKTALADVREDLQSMADMLNELLLFSRSGLSLEASALERVPLLPVVNKIIAQEGGNTAVQTSVAADVCALARYPMLERALANLLRNAVRYSGDEASPIEIDAALQGQRIILCVRDRGPGVPESALARLGEPFFRPELSRSRAMGGVGLGLAIVRRCVAACDGTVIFRNRPGGGFEAQLELHSA